MPPQDIGNMPFLASRPVVVTVPASVLFDLSKIQKVMGGVLGRLGCPQCHSGFDIRLDLERQFVFDINAKLQSIAGVVIVDG